MDPNTVAETLRQVVEGDDIPVIKNLLKRLKAEDASRVLPGFPYSILTNLAHADHWQGIWLNRIEGKPRPKLLEDWRVPEPDEYEAVRSSFLANLDRAQELAAARPFAHSMKSGDSALNTLLALAIHDAYHIGQIKLMCQVLGKAADADD